MMEIYHLYFNIDSICRLFLKIIADHFTVPPEKKGLLLNYLLSRASECTITDMS